jgi:hypothetical protein
MVTGQTFTVIFPVAGNFKLTCLVHVNMDGRIHVLPASDPLPHDQAFYDEQAASRSDELLSHGAKMKPLHVPNSPLGVTAGITDITGTAGGTETIAAVRFPTRISESVPVKQSNGITRLQSSRIPLPSGRSRQTFRILPPT